MRILLILSLLLLNIPSSPAQEPAPLDPTNQARTVAFYGVAHADLNEVKATVEQMIGPAGQVAIDTAGRRLIVHAPSQTQSLVAELVRGMDLPPRNVQVEVLTKTLNKTSDKGVGVGGSGRSTPTPQGRSTRINIKARVQNETVDEAGTSRQILLVQSGKEGSIRVGESVPYLEWLMDYGRRYGYFQGEIHWQEVGTFLVVEPQIIGEGPQIRLRLTPEISGFADRRDRRRIKFSSVTTEVIVNSGETLTLGGLGQNKDFSSHFLVGMDQESQHQTLEFTLRPTILDGRGQAK